MEAGLTIAYESVVTGVYIDGKKVAGVKWFREGSFKNTGSKIVIDCTAEAEVCDLAGCETHKGRDVDSQCQPYTNILVTRKENRVICRNTDCGYVDQTDGEELSRALIESSTLPLHLRDTYDAAERLLYLTQHLGVREGRAVVGEENITLKECLEDKVTDKPLFFSYSNIDNHGKDVAFESELLQDWLVVCSLFGINLSVPVPMGAIIPKGYDGILAAARHLAADHDIASLVRMKRDIQKCGEAAAILAYAAVKIGCKIKDVPYDYILPLLKENKCLNEENNIKMKEAASTDDTENQKIDWMNDKEEIQRLLSSDKPGIAIWSCRRMNEKISADLTRWLSDENENLKRNSALALGLLGDRRALPVLRRMAAEKDAFMPKTRRKYNHPRGLAAVYLLGKLRDRASLSELKELILGGEDQLNIEACEFIEDNGEYYFHYYIHALMALIKIGGRYPEKRDEIAEAIHKSFGRKGFSLHINLKAGNRQNYDMTAKVKEIALKLIREW